jgi:hypothetical protein
MRIERKLTIDELVERLALSRSTIYYWVRDLPIPGSGSGTGLPAAAQPKGTIAMQRVPDTRLRARLQAWMDCLRTEWQ